MLDALTALLPLPKEPQDVQQPAQPDALRVAIIGRPNVGKSSLVNALVGLSGCAKAARTPRPACAPPQLRAASSRECPLSGYTLGCLGADAGPPMRRPASSAPL